MSFGFENPNYVGQYFVFLLIVSYLFNTSRIIRVFAVVASVVFLILMQSENNLIFVFIVLFYVLLKSSKYKILFQMFLFSVSLPLIFLASGLSLSEINVFLSGRILTWGFQLSEIYNQGVLSLIVGTRRFIPHVYEEKSYSRLLETAGAFSQKIHSSTS